MKPPTPSRARVEDSSFSTEINVLLNEMVPQVGGFIDNC